VEHAIEITGLTRDYGQGRGLFDVDLTVAPGEVFGLVGINGAGKTTMIRHLMGFLRSRRGRCRILGGDCWRQAAELKRHIGHIPGEIAFPDVKTGLDFLELQASYTALRDLARADDLAARFDLDVSAPLKRMSKGMKQKTAIVAAFMSGASVLLLDEGSTGLDPLMQKVFTGLVAEEKAKGRTVFMSSHMFDELEAVCDRVAFLKEGRIIEVARIAELGGNEAVKEYKIEFAAAEDYQAFLARRFDLTRRQDQFNQASVRIARADIGALFQALACLDVKFITQVPRTLAAHFAAKYHDTEGAHHA
jgi:ABC-2 type transport system ATP-binding protein